MKHQLDGMPHTFVGSKSELLGHWIQVEAHRRIPDKLPPFSLVYAPARSVGKYGGDVDNWMWPRHTGDFSFLRAYVGPDGKPADPAPENVPYHPEHWLRIAVDGVKDGDFVMVAGYPGGTNRYRLADEVENRINWYYPMRAKVYGDLLASIDRAVEQYPDAKLKLAPMISGLNNTTKNYAGMLAGFDRTDVVAAKRELEAGLEAWIDADPENNAAYGTALEELQALLVKDQKYQERDLYWGVVSRWSMLSSASRLYRLSQERKKPDMEREPGYQERDLDRMRRRLERMETSYDARVDRQVSKDRILMYATLAPENRIAAFDNYFGIGPGGADDAALDRILDEMYNKTKLEDLDTRLGWMDASVEEFEASADPFIRLAVALYPAEREMEDEEEALKGEFEDVRPRFMEALIAYQRSRGVSVYSDANSTLRVTTGHVAGYEPRDGVWYLPFTTLEGLLEKETGEEPFDSPPALLEAIRAGEYGPYGLENLGSVPLDFLSTLDTTGGNSGSPTLNGRGELAGLLFDGAWESLLSDWYYEDERVRSIHTDVRYMLWVMDRVDKAHRLLKEMGVKPSFAGE
ncbi:MAG: S46 family peptidase [Candidatus Eisenbacteria bacterium]|nr:S46 family peptidase [Candidatus Eisenbacteria bacterium]